MPPRAAAAFIADVARTDTPAHCAARSAPLADLELSSRGGSMLDADTLALRTIAAITAAERASYVGLRWRDERGAPRVTSCAHRCCGAARRS